jgi:hypothetical protein
LVKCCDWLIFVGNDSMELQPDKSNIIMKRDVQCFESAP